MEHHKGCSIILIHSDIVKRLSILYITLLKEITCSITVFLPGVRKIEVR